MGLKINNDPVNIASGGAQETTKTYIWEIEGLDTAEYRLTELDQLDPKGRWRARAHGNQLLIEAASEKNWAQALTYLIFDGATKKVLLQRHLENLRGEDVDDTLTALSDRIDELAEHIRYIVLALADLGLDLPETTTDLLNDLIWHPSELVYGPAMGL